MLKFALTLCCLVPSFLLADSSPALYDDSQMGRVDIVCAEGVMDWLYDAENLESDSMHLAQVHFSNAQISEHISEVGFRLRGNTSRVSQKKSYKLSFNTFVPGREFYDVDKVNLNGEHNDPSIVRSKLAWDLYQQTDTPASRAAHTEVWVNDRYQGLYLSIEHIDDEFLWKNFDDDSGNLWKCLWPADLTWRGSDVEAYKYMQGDRRTYELKTNKDEDDYTPLFELIRLLHECPAYALDDSLGQYLHVEGVLEYFAMNVLTGNWDDYWFLMNNFYLYHEPKLDRMQLIPYDYDNCLGIDWFDIEWALRNPYNFGQTNRPLAERILMRPRWRNLYTHILQHWSETLLDESAWEAQLQRLYTLCEPAAFADTFRTLDYGFSQQDYSDSWGESYQNQHVQRGLREFRTMRVASLPGQLTWRDAGPEAWLLTWEPSAPTLQDSIHVRTAAFSHEADLDVQLRWRLDDAEWQLAPMAYTGDPNDARLSVADRYSCTLPPAQTAQTLEMQVLLADAQGSTRLYPPLQARLLRFPLVPEGLALNEFLAKNDSQGSDEAGEFDDWVELINKSQEPVDLSGSFLSDDPDNLLRWAFPADMPLLEVDELLVIWCDQDEDQGPLHTNFKLSGSGEFLALTAADGVSVHDSLTFGNQETDISFGRLPDGVGAWQALLTPSPGEVNESVDLAERKSAPASFDFEVYPNPFNGALRLRLPANAQSVRVYDLRGGLRFYDEIELHTRDYLLGEALWFQLPSGIYLVEVSGAALRRTHKVTHLK
jgi:hypothetical protein